MFSVGINYLNGWSMAASDGANKKQTEWPPHPDRLFMAMAAAWFETGKNRKEEDALRWFETLPPPEISASEHTIRKVVTAYVPVNDIKSSSVKPGTKMDHKKLKKSGLALLPKYRIRNEQRFPIAIPKDPIVYMIWNNTDLLSHRSGIESLFGKITSLGHPASFVQVWAIENEEKHPNLVPTNNIGNQNLRMFTPGRLDLLAQNYRNNIRPTPVMWQSYSRIVEPIPIKNMYAIFDPNLIILRINNTRLPLHATLNLVTSLRNSIMKYCKDPIPEWISGHKVDKTFTTKPHIAIFPLSFVDNKYADGRIMGLSIALPTTIDKNEVEHQLNKFLYERNDVRTTKLFNGKWFECEVELETRENPPKTLQSITWTRESPTWASVTPVVLNRHFKGKDKWEQVTEHLKDLCVGIGLPRPKDIILHPTSLVKGAPPAKEYPKLTRKTDGGKIYHLHVIITFAEPVQGPIIIGAGRFRGYGLLKPME